jgi:outer membrane biosynthesis protein TonB
LKSTRAEARPNDFSPWNADRGQIVNPMAEKSAKKKPKKAAKASADPSVLGALPSTRPTRLGGDRRAATTRTPAATTAKPKPAAAKTKPAVAAKAKPKAAAPKPKAKPKAVKQPPRTSAPPAGWEVPGDGDGQRDGGPTEIVTTAVQAAGELAQIGLTVGGQILRRAANRLPGR